MWKKNHFFWQQNNSFVSIRSFYILVVLCLSLSWQQHMAVLKIATPLCATDWIQRIALNSPLLKMYFLCAWLQVFYWWNSDRNSIGISNNVCLCNNFFFSSIFCISKFFFLLNLYTLVHIYKSTIPFAYRDCAFHSPEICNCVGNSTNYCYWRLKRGTRCPVN